VAGFHVITCLNVCIGQSFFVLAVRLRRRMVRLNMYCSVASMRFGSHNLHFFTQQLIFILLVCLRAHSGTGDIVTGAEDARLALWGATEPADDGSRSAAGGKVLPKPSGDGASAGHKSHPY
jgi:hypothetical protein